MQILQQADPFGVKTTATQIISFDLPANYYCSGFSINKMYVEKYQKIYKLGPLGTGRYLLIPQRQLWMELLPGVWALTLSAEMRVYATYCLTLTLITFMTEKDNTGYEWVVMPTVYIYDCIISVYLTLSIVVCFYTMLEIIIVTWQW